MCQVTVKHAFQLFQCLQYQVGVWDTLPPSLNNQVSWEVSDLLAPCSLPFTPAPGAGWFLLPPLHRLDVCLRLQGHPDRWPWGSCLTVVLTLLGFVASLFGFSLVFLLSSWPCSVVCELPSPLCVLTFNVPLTYSSQSTCSSVTVLVTSTIPFSVTAPRVVRLSQIFSLNLSPVYLTPSCHICFSQTCQINVPRTFSPQNNYISFTSFFSPNQ